MAEASQLSWVDDAIELAIETGADGIARLSRLEPVEKGGRAGDAGLAGLPLLDVVTAQDGHIVPGRRYVDSAIGARMLFDGHSELDDHGWHVLRIHLRDPQSALTAEVEYRVLVGAGVLRSRVTVRNSGAAPVTLHSVTSFLLAGLGGAGASVDDIDLWVAENDWCAEARWEVRPLRDSLPALQRNQGRGRDRTRLTVTSQGSWSSGDYLPMGLALDRQTGGATAWQIEHNGPWHWEVGGPRSAGSTCYLAALGPTDTEHHWRQTLNPGETFETVPVAVAVSGDGFEGAVSNLTRYRRALRRDHRDNRSLPVIFNDYMNTIMADPTEERLLPLINAASLAGAECFCIDAGWFNDIGAHWWETVGEWRPSTSRFPRGLGWLMQEIRERGMIPGLWLEPEVVSVTSPVADSLPDGAFFTRGGVRLVEAGRYHLDLSNDAARQHLDETVDRLVRDLGVGYLKLDYNVSIAPGTDAGGTVAPGAGLLAHNRAMLEWLDQLLDRHPDLTIESCSSGGMRTDYAILARTQLHSTSDQRDFLLYPPIAAGVLAAVLPEQAGIWAYPQPGWGPDEIAFTMCNAMLGRIHLSGHLDRMSGPQAAIVAEAVSVYKRIRGDLPTATPFWPLGLPRWADEWVVAGLRGATAVYLVVWRRGLEEASQLSETGTGRIAIPLAGKDSLLQPEILFPSTSASEAIWDSSSGTLRIRMSTSPSALLVRLHGTEHADDRPTRSAPGQSERRGGERIQ